MSDLISRQALRDAMYHEAFETDTEMQRWDSGCWIRYKLFENVIDSLPSAERKGKWILTDYPDEQTYQCSACNEIWTFIEGTPIDNGAFYCPNCGARMEGSE